MELQKELLFQEARKARAYSYSPYSHFAVGAALLTCDGQLFCGCNIENAAYGPSICAERCAIFTAVSKGCRDFAAIAIAGGPTTDGNRALVTAYPCGVCRQVMSEFCDPDTFQIIVGTDETQLQTFLLKDLLPHGFSL